MRLIDADKICEKCPTRRTYRCNICEIGLAPTEETVMPVHGETYNIVVENLLPGMESE